MKLITIAIPVFLYCILTISCNTVHKTFSKEAVKSDSSRVVKNIESKVSKSDSAGTKTGSGAYARQTIYQYDTIYKEVKGKTVIKYVPRILTVYETGNYKNDQTTQLKLYDSGVVSQSDSSKVVTSTVSIDKDKKSSRTPLWIAVFAIGILLLLVLIYSPSRQPNEPSGNQS